MTKSPWIGITWLGTSPFDHVPKYKWIDSTKSKNDSNHSIESINQLIIYVDHFLAKPSTSFTFSFRGNLLSRWPFWGIFWINSIESIIPAPQSQLDSAPLYGTNWLRHPSTQLLKELNRLNPLKEWIYLIQPTQSSDWHTTLRITNCIFTFLPFPATSDKLQMY